MTKNFLEIQFTEELKDIIKGYPPEIIRLAVAHETEAKDIYDKLDISIKNRPHAAFLHGCNHSNIRNAPCIMKELAKVEK